jgi:hypothetical protein
MAAVGSGCGAAGHDPQPRHGSAGQDSQARLLCRKARAQLGTIERRSRHTAAPVTRRLEQVVRGSERVDETTRTQLQRLPADKLVSMAVANLMLSGRALQTLDYTERTLRRQRSLTGKITGSLLQTVPEVNKGCAKPEIDQAI